MISDQLIKENIIENGLIYPYQPELLNPNSYDLTLLELKNKQGEVFKSKWINPDEFILASTIETVNIPPHLVGEVWGKSSIARKGLLIHAAGLVDTGFRGQLTLEMKNLTDEPIYVEEGMRIGQIVFHTVEGEVESLYDGHYQDQKGATESAI